MMPRQKDTYFTRNLVAIQRPLHWGGPTSVCDGIFTKKSSKKTIANGTKIGYNYTLLN